MIGFEQRVLSPSWSNRLVRHLHSGHHHPPIKIPPSVTMPKIYKVCASYHPPFLPLNRHLYKQQKGAIRTPIHRLWRPNAA